MAPTSKLKIMYFAETAPVNLLATQFLGYVFHALHLISLSPDPSTFSPLQLIIKKYI